MAIFLRGNTYWYEFTFAGKRIRESSKSSRKTIAKEAEKNRRLELEKTLAGIPVEQREKRIESVADVLKRYEGSYSANHRPAAIAYLHSALKNVVRLMGNVLIPDVTEGRVRDYMSARTKEGASGRTVNAELGELSRAIGRHWSFLWPRVKKMEERKDVGRALSPDEERRLLDAADGSRSPNLKTLVRLALMTGMRAGELTTLRWAQVDLGKRLITVGKAKTAAGTGRQIPMSADLYEVLTSHSEWFTAKFGSAFPEHYLFPFGSPMPNDPKRPTVELKTAWNTIRKAAEVNCRWHDLRHTACTKLAEAGVAEFVMQAIMGHMSRAMLERYSHVRLNAKRAAVEAMSIPTKNPLPTKSPTVAPADTIQ